MEKILKKLGSRKLWLALGGLFTGIAMVFGVDSGELNTVAGAVTTVASVVAYILAEGGIDAAAARAAIRQAADAASDDDGRENP